VSGGQQIEVLYFGVRDEEYPRNERVREYLERELSARVTVVGAAHTKSRIKRYLVQLVRALTLPGRFDVVVLAEFSLSFFPFSWILAKRNRALHVVDFFVGLHETEVGDAAVTSALSLRGRLLSWVDRSAISSADVCFTDTHARAERFAQLARGRVPFVSLPVGAPDWARDESVGPSHRAAGPTRVLYYGSYLPLHGLDQFISSLRTSDEGRIIVEMIGQGPERAGIELLVSQLALDSVVSFADYMPPQELNLRIHSADIVIGVFGQSDKAAEVIPNKVWQGLSMSRVVVTRESVALGEISEVAGGLLVQVPFADPGSIRAAIDGAVLGVNASATSGIAERLERLVISRFDDAFATMPLSSVFKR
jgi:glycosyltransferase involved in cell wall biosynthesis